MPSQGSKEDRDESEKFPLLKKLRAVEIGHVTQRKERSQSTRQEEALARALAACNGNQIKPPAVPTGRKG